MLPASLKHEGYRIRGLLWQKRPFSVTQRLGIVADSDERVRSIVRPVPTIIILGVGRASRLR